MRARRPGPVARNASRTHGHLGRPLNNALTRHPRPRQNDDQYDSPATFRTPIRRAIAAGKDGAAAEQWSAAPAIGCRTFLTQTVNAPGRRAAQPRRPARGGARPWGSSDVTNTFLQDVQKSDRHHHPVGRRHQHRHSVTLRDSLNAPRRQPGRCQPCSRARPTRRPQAAETLKPGRCHRPADARRGGTARSPAPSPPSMRACSRDSKKR